MSAITLRATCHRERSAWIGWCPDLDVATQGDSREEAEAHLREAVGLFLETCRDLGTLEDVLREAGRLTPPGVENGRIPASAVAETGELTLAPIAPDSGRDIRPNP